MSAKRYVVTLTEQERAHLQGLMRGGRVRAFRRRRAQILLQVDVEPRRPGRTYAETAHMLSVARTRRAFQYQGLAAALKPSPLDHPRRARKLDEVG